MKGCEKNCIINPFDVYFIFITRIWPFIELENGGKSHYEINVFLKYTLDTIIGTPRNSYE